MKIAYFTSNRTTFPAASDQIAASSTVTIELITHLASRHEITLFAAKGSQVPNIKVVDLNLPPFTVDSNITDNDLIAKASQGMKQIYLGEIFNRAHEFDLIHLQTAPIYLAMPYVGLIKTPVLFTSHNNYNAFEKEIYKFYDKKIYFSALSHSQASQFPLTQKIPVIYNGIEISKYPFQDNSQDYFLFLGRLHKDKGIDIYLELAHNLSQYSFYIAGKGHQTYEKRIKTYTDQHKNINYPGMLPHESPEWFDLLSKAKALLMPITYEDSCPLVPLEAMACGTPVIAYAKGALPEQVIDNKTGFIVNSSDTDIRGEWIIKRTGIEGLYEAIERIYNMPADQYHQMRQNCRKHVEENFTVERMVNEYEKVYQQILG